MLYRFKKNLMRLIGERNRRIVVAVSGGPDSICMLHLLCSSIPKERLLVAHVNFNLRGIESDADESFVRGMAEKLGVDARFKSVDTLAYARERSISVEMAARELRYGWFEELKSSLGYDYIAVAHNANDNAETMLLNLCRGTGLRGICGMRVEDCRGVIRPLLPFSRSEIEQYLKSNSISYRTDSTNSENIFARNRIRNSVIGQLRHINPSIISTLNENIGRFSQAYLLLESVVGEYRRRALLSAGEYFSRLRNGDRGEYLTQRLSAPYMVAAIEIAPIEQSGEEACGYLLFNLLSEYGFNPAQISGLRKGLMEGGIKRLVSPRHIAIKERGYIKIYLKEVAEKREEKRVGVQRPGESVIAEFGGVKISLTLLEGRGNTKELSERDLFISADNLSFPLQLRGMRPGDRFSPFGLGGSKKLSDYYTDIKMDNAIRGSIPLLLPAQSPDTIVALPGLEISEKFRVTPDSRSLLKITLL